MKEYLEFNKENINQEITLNKNISLIQYVNTVKAIENVKTTELYSLCSLYISNCFIIDEVFKTAEKQTVLDLLIENEKLKLEIINKCSFKITTKLSMVLNTLDVDIVPDKTVINLCYLRPEQRIAQYKWYFERIETYYVISCLTANYEVCELLSITHKALNEYVKKEYINLTKEEIETLNIVYTFIVKNHIYKL